LLEHKAEIERALYLRLRDLFSLQIDVIFYDLTLTYFEGKGPPAIGAYGHSRDGRPRTRRCWSAWFWSMAGRSLITCLPAIGATP
jgi:hypothetical protein